MSIADLKVVAVWNDQLDMDSINRLSALCDQAAGPGQQDDPNYDPHHPHSRSKGEKARNRKNRGR